MQSYNRTLKRRRAEQFLRYHATLLEPGQGMPPIRLLCSVSGIGRVVIQNTLAYLVEQGILECRDRSGYYRTERPLSKNNSDKTIDIFACSVIGYLSPSVLFPQKFFNSIFVFASNAGYNCRVHGIHLDESISAYEEKIDEYNVNLALLFSPHSKEVCKCFEKKCIRWTCVFPRFAPLKGSYLAESDDLVTSQMQYLYERGHRRIAFIDEFDIAQPAWLFLIRRERYYRFMAEHALKVEKHYLFPQSYEKNIFDERLDKMFANKAPSAAIVPGAMLTHFYEYCAEKNIKIPGDISVITFEKRPDLNLQPTPCSLAYDYTKMAEIAFNKLFETASNDKVEITRLPTEILQEESVAKIL